MYPLHRTDNRGFTLVEVAVVMVIIGLIVTFAASILRNVGGLTKLRDAKDRLTSTTDSVTAFAGKNNRLPVFTEFSSTSGSFNYKDAWMRSYQLYPKLTFANTPFSNFTGNGLSTFCGRTTTRFSLCLSTNNCSDSNRIDNIAFVLLSPGQNLAVNSSYPNIGINSCPSGKVCLGVSEPSTTYDDLYRYVTLTELKKMAGCIESDARLHIITNELPFGNISTAYYNNVSITAAGGLPWSSGGAYKWRLNHGNLTGTGITISPLTFPPISSASLIPADKLTVTGTPVATGTHGFSVVVQDSNNNTYSKSFVLTIKPKP